MADSSTPTIVAKWRRWKKRHPEFPLSVHGSGQWCKRVGGRYRYFGPLERPSEALILWNRKKDYYLAGEEYPQAANGSITVAGLCERFKEKVEAGRDAGKLSKTHARDLLHAVDFVLANMVKSRPVASIRPEHFAKLGVAVSKTGRALRSQRNLMAAIRQMFIWGGSRHGKGMKLYPDVDFGPEFQMPGSDALAREAERSGKSRFFDRAVILALLKEAKPAMRCMILLGVNCGFYASDSIALTFDRLHLDHDIPHHDMARVKNGRRRVAALWPETVEALEAYIEHHRRDSDSDRVLLNQYGRPYTEDAVGRGIRVAFANLAAKAKVALQPGASIGSLRHTYGTVVDLASDQQMIDLSMGHAPKGMQKRIYSQLNLGELDRLEAVAEVVRQWLYHGTLAGVSERKKSTPEAAVIVPYPVVG